MIRRTARVAALAAAAADLAAAGLDWHRGGWRVPLHVAALFTALAMVPCALAFLAAVGAQVRRTVSMRGPVRTIDTIRLPLVVPRGYVGGAVLGGVGTLAAMGEAFGLYIFLAGTALIALALSQAKPRRLARR